MKILTLVAVAAAAVLAVPAASASAVPSAAAIWTAAAPAVQDHRRWDRNERRYERRVHRRSYWRTTCTRKWRNGHRVRVCRKVRYYR